MSFDESTGDFIEVLVSNDSNDNGGLTAPVGMVVDGNGDLLVSSQGTNSILRYDLTDGTFLGEFASPATGATLAGPAKIEFGPNGNLFVANFFGNSVDAIATDGTYWALSQAVVLGLPAFRRSPLGLWENYT